jgi:hypothetical protein
MNKHPFTAGKATFKALPLEKASSDSILYSPNRVGEGCWRADWDIFKVDKPSKTHQYKAKWAVFLNNNRYIFESSEDGAQNLAFNSICTEIDVLGAIFYFISRYEEWDWYVPDTHQRYPSEANTLVGHEQLPVVDLMLYYLLVSLGIEPNASEQPLIVSHDLDYLEKYPSVFKKIKRLGHTLFIQRSVPIFLKTLGQLFLGFDPYINLERLFLKDSESEKYLFLMVGGKVAGLEGHYAVQNPKVSSILKLAKERNYKIGIHPSYNTYSDAELYKKEVQVFEQTLKEKAKYNRQHFLRWRFPQTANNMEEAGVMHDFTLGFNDRIGFRCGTSFPFQLYNFEKERAYNFTSHPVVIMDVALLRQAGYNPNDTSTHKSSVKRAMEIIIHFKKRLKQMPCSYKMSINFHNSTFDSAAIDEKGLWQLYEQLTSE